MNDNAVSSLKCSIVRVFYSKENFSICECSTKGKIPDEAIREFNEKTSSKIFTALGYGLSTKIRQDILLSGNWENNQKFGYLQLRITDCEDYVGRSRTEIVSYLSSNILKGIGKKTAERIYDSFGENALEVIENDPEKLLSIPGIKKKKLGQIIESFEAHRDFHNLTLLLSKYDVSYRTIVRIQRTLGKGATRSIKRNPYILCRVSGFGFKTADKLALEMGHPSNSQFRIEGAIAYTLDKAQNDGHVFLSRKQLVSISCSDNVLNNSSCDTKIHASQVEEVISNMLQHGQLKQGILKSTKFSYEDTPIYKDSDYIYETFAARKVEGKLRELVKKQDWADVVANTEGELGVSLDEKQALAAIMGLSSPISVITGGPGTGKTTSLKVIVHAYLSLYPKNTIALAAPTGRAARRMSEQTKMSASTIHSLLGLKPDSYTDFLQAPTDEEMVDADLLILDESSMIDAHLLAELMYRVKFKTQVIFLGDSDQLPSVGAGNVLFQLLISKEIPHVKLEKIFRQSEDSIIPVNAANIRQGIDDLHFNKYFRFIQCEGEEHGAEVIKELIQRSINRGTFSSTQILCPMKKRGAASTGNLNNILHDIVNPADPSKSEAVVAGILFRVGDKVMQTRNIEGASNGDIGYIVGIKGDVSDQENFTLTVQYDASTPPLQYSYEGALDLIHALAITIHKSQGSEFDAVIVPIFNSMSFFLRRNVLYTAITRAKKQVLLISDGPGISTAIRREDTSKRNTLLSHFIADFHEKNYKKMEE